MCHDVINCQKHRIFKKKVNFLEILIGNSSVGNKGRASMFVAKRSPYIVVNVS